jgi:hypothetical protein
MDFKIVWDVVDWIHVVQEGGRWWAVVNTVTNLRVQQMAGTSCVT